jgi:hypothetical protein
MLVVANHPRISGADSDGTDDVERVIRCPFGFAVSSLATIYMHLLSAPLLQLIRRRNIKTFQRRAQNSGCKISASVSLLGQGLPCIASLRMVTPKFNIGMNE